jgi:hypothetical protein
MYLLVRARLLVLVFVLFVALRGPVEPPVIPVVPIPGG